MAYCRQYTAVKAERVAQVAVSLPCNCWHCDECGENRKRQLIAEGMAGNPTTFLTLTYRARESVTPDQAAPQLSRAWRLVRLRLMRHYKLKKLPFLAVMEKTKLGWPHLHILIRTRYLDHKLIKAWMAEIIQSPVIWIEKINNKKKANGYCAKYCSKATQKFATAKRYWQSQDYDLRPPEDDPRHLNEKGDWQLRDAMVHIVALNWRQAGGAVQWISDNKAILFYPNASSSPPLEPEAGGG